MGIYKNDIIKASAISTGADRGVLLCSITDSGFTSIAGVISAVKDRLPNEDHKKNKSIVIKSRKQYVYVILVFSFLLKGAPACEGMRSLYLYNA